MGQIIEFTKKTIVEEKKTVEKMSKESIRLWHMDLDIVKSVDSAIKDGANPIVIAGLLSNRISTLLALVDNKEDRMKIVNEICKRMFTEACKK